MKKNNVLSIIWSLSFLFIALGATFSYFSTRVSGDEGSVYAKSSVIGINISVIPKFESKELIPMNDKDLDKAYANECVDIYNFGACQAYNIHIDNLGDELDYIGTIKFSVNEITNLNYKILTEIPMSKIQE